MRLHCPLLTALVACCAAGTLHGQMVPPDDSARSETIERLLVVADMEHIYAQTIETGAATRLRANPAMAPYADLLQAFLRRYASYDIVKPDLVRLYRETFSETEVQELVRFYQTDFGRRFAAKMAMLGARSGELAAARIQAHLPELTAEIMGRARDMPPQ